MRLGKVAVVGLASTVAVGLLGCNVASEPCRVEEGDEGTVTILCPDGTSAVLSDGRDGSSCTVSENGDGTKTLACDDGTTAVVRDGEPGEPGAAGRSCSVSEVDGYVVVTCEDGTSGTLSGRPQGTLHGDFEVTDALDAFLLQGFTRVTGDLTLRPPAETLPSQALRRVDGDLRVYLGRLRSMEGLERLESIGGDLYLGAVSVLRPTTPASLVGLDRLVAVEGDLHIESQDLENLIGLGRLETVDGSLIIRNTELLRNLSGLSALSRIGGSVLIGVGGEYSRDLESLDGLVQLSEVAGDLRVDSTPLKSLAGLESLTRIGGYLALTNNRDLTSIDALNGLESLGNQLTIRGNPALPQCEALGLQARLEDLGWIEAAFISGNDVDGSCE